MTKRSALEHKLQKAVNRYARLRDCGDQGGCECISCGRWKPFSEGDGGHFIPSTSSAIRYDLRNVNFQCIACNRFKSVGRQYYPGMVKKYGLKVTKELETQEGKTKKWSIPELEEMLAEIERLTEELA